MFLLRSALSVRSPSLVQLREDVECMSSHLDTLLPVLTELMGYKQSMVSGEQENTHECRPAVQSMEISRSSSCPVAAAAVCVILQRVRLTCLECVSHLRRLPYEQLHPHRSRILAALARAADDHKRAVRQAATRARNQWYLLTQ